jgi:hypothetical protein
MMGIILYFWRFAVLVASPKVVFALLISIVMLAFLPACSTQSKTAGLNMLPLDKMPAEVQAAPSLVQQSYQFAAANPDVMKGIPCYCGCGNIGHTSNYSCYVQSTDANGNLTFDNHALGCSLCVNITQDAMRLLKEGKTVSQIKAYVDATYGNYGTSNMP